MYCAVLKLCGAVLLTGKKLESGRSILFAGRKNNRTAAGDAVGPQTDGPARGEAALALGAAAVCASAAETSVPPKNAAPYK